MSRYLIFRTDRIGDFIFSRMIINSIKKDNPKNKIDFVCSYYNSKYVKNYTDINKIYILDKYNLFLMIKNMIQINNSGYDYIIILDGKRRSVFFSMFLSAKNKIAVLKDFRPYLILKIFFNNYFINSDVNSQFDNFSSLINYLDIKVSNKINYYDNYKFKKDKFKNLHLNFTLLHLDEKWFEGFYYSDYKYIDLNINNFSKFIKTINKKFKKDIIITSGLFNIKTFNSIKEFFFVKRKKNTYVSNKFKFKLMIIENTDFRDLENIVKKCNELICCEGAISHVSNSFSKKTYALINDTKIGNFWTKHMKNLILIKRNNINNICKQIISLSK
jgi:ADP-heptose:LPS heptosyltransferase